MKKIIITLLIGLCFSGCLNFLNPNDKPDYKNRIVIKSVNFSPWKVEWYHYSLLTSYSPGIIEIKKDSPEGNIVCKSSYISDINYRNDSLIISFWANDTVTIRKFTWFATPIGTDTTGKQPSF